MTLHQQVVLITGADGGLGTSVTNAFLDAGARVVGLSPSIAKANFPTGNFLGLAGEISHGDHARTFVADAIAKLGRLDTLVHLVGAFDGGRSVAETGDATLDRMLDLNFRTAFYMIRAVLPSMREQRSGRILAIGSKAAVEPSPLAGVYAASKAALVSLIRTVACENSDRNITANVVLPATMDTPANRAAMPGADFSKWVHPGQVAKLLVHLATAAASQVNGAVIPIYGSEA
jgi:NAD(P)-dependent dehydrogenase (short-subunit alcohol dehydrogenase family)